MQDAVVDGLVSNTPGVSRCSAACTSCRTRNGRTTVFCVR